MRKVITYLYRVNKQCDFHAKLSLAVQTHSAALSANARFTSGSEPLAFE